MKRGFHVVLAGLLLLCVASPAAADNQESVETYSIWLGAHYTDFNDYAKSVNEYGLISDNAFPEFGVSYFSRTGSSVFKVDGQYFDYENVNAGLSATVGNKFRLESKYRSMTRQLGQDLLANMAARELIGETPGGKILTHELTDVGADYNYHRQEITNAAELLLSTQYNVRMVVAHKFLSKDGNEQKIASSHCFSCHLTSQSIPVKRRTHQFEAGLDAEVSKYDFGYRIGYRQFGSEAPEAYSYYDPAKHPVNGGSGAEFSSRQVFDDVSVPVGVYPDIEKISHKFRVKGDVGTGQFAAAFSYANTENRRDNLTGIHLESQTYAGNLNVTMPLTKKSRLVAKVSGKRVKNDDPYIDLPTFRDGRGGVEQSFDFYRYSNLDRKVFTGSAEYISRMTDKLTIGVLGGYDYTMRYDYPEFESEEASGTLIGQLKFTYREGMKYTIRGKYRLEKTSDPFTSGRGLFESRGRGVINPLIDGFSFTFYFQREGLRYQDITTSPTDRHEAEVKATMRPDNRVTVMLGAKFAYDKNGDLDSLDVKHTSFVPNLNITLTPNTKWTMATGYTLNYGKSRGPVTVALFDG